MLLKLAYMWTSRYGLPHDVVWLMVNDIVERNPQLEELTTSDIQAVLLDCPDGTGWEQFLEEMR